ncbi:oxidoreductase [Loigolactobacillus backii]|uniref:Short-chain dehydrogenase/reductase n=1 Tax=Loigolactobacillus backii TaxID=375175 RepID=A0A192GZS7_9LACO|nr:oxidoreductase [Loigolactobacillus backii]ANK60826.1 short-chain dehydrogenase/reductase [Loigolactobacillus backii]ANK61600.1 short-chain dehydrogenase/reductase [Loigolactobacillus backii]ANK65779.1 short-chain dehydrogenase/reductase [Loigolactobacillus backii]ANK68256.1 short-chain dehydrogenase/reductase [Loigolactobacillus backii]ANK69200.1 short-chain dehydrogenase/reductase [Loigolactobacillus backii]
MKKVVLITGASSGIGEATAIRLKRAGFIVYAAARRMERMRHLVGLGINIINLDVTVAESRENVIKTILASEGRLDILINNAGYGAYGAVEDVSLAEGKNQFEVNVFGAIALIKLALPIMRHQGSGRIINTSSIGGKIYQPMGAWYMGTKHALEGMLDSLRTEVSQFGIDIVIIEPGCTKTEWPGIARKKLLAVSGQTAYAKTAQKAGAMLSLFNQFGSDTSVIANVMEKAACARRPKTRYVAGAGSTISLVGRKYLSDRTFDALLAGTLTLCWQLYQHQQNKAITDE